MHVTQYCSDVPPLSTPDTRTRLLHAAAELVSASPGQDVPLRAICDAAGVKPPTLYHFFGSKDGLLDQLVEHGFDLYLARKEGAESSGDPIEDLRAGWDAHVAFGVEHPGFYALMYGQTVPGRRPAAQDRPTHLLLEICREAQRQGRLVVDPEQAAAHVLAANVGVTLRQIVLAEPDPALSAQVREATIAALTGTSPSASDPAKELLEQLGTGRRQPLQAEELALLRVWLRRIRDADDGS